MKLPLPVLILALVAALASAALSARPGGFAGFGHDPGFHLLDVLADDLGLTEEQETEIDELMNETRLATAVDRERMSQIREQLRRLSRTDEAFDSGAASALAEELASIISRAVVTGSETRWKMRQVLTAEQRQQMDGLTGGRWHPLRQFEGLDGPAD